MYLLHPGMYITEVIIFQYLYCLGIRNTARKEVTNCDTFQCTKGSNVKCGKLPAKKDEVITWKNSVCI